MREGTCLLTRLCSRNTQVTPATTTTPVPQVCICGDVWMTWFILFASQANPVTPRDVSTPPATKPTSTSDPSGNLLDSSDISLTTGTPPLVAAPAPAPAPAPVPTTVSCPTPEPVLAHNSPTPAPATQTNSEESPSAQNNIPPA